MKKNQKKKKITIIVDGTNYLYRSYFSFKNLKNKKKKPIGVIYGTLVMLKKIFNKYFPKKIIIVFDHYKPNFRKKIYPKYKSTRKKTPTEIIKQSKKLIKIIKYMGIPTIKIPGFEADDIIGTLVRNIKKKGEKILILTNDKDLMQLINKNVKILSHKKKIIDKKKVIKKFGISPKLIQYFLAIVGDRSDNIPGIPGIGIKTAQIILNKFSSLKKIYKNLNKLYLLNVRNSYKLKNIFIKYKKIAFISNLLTKINTKVKISILKKKLNLKKPNKKKIFEYFKKNDFKKLKKSFKKSLWFNKL
ncbi:MAG: 5'-3' exonuclease [Buchnera aphidicola (Periphyllus lyropictus)]|uniref:5'-3' exonuclease n=1 Tax=Buchnera aphidicola TaxID=9 RepID=UPI001EB7F1DB|nr:5'-3' exonuclease H3TH domain-containing protein [Buchnera aphidicola]NIH16549.1 5'-3' exonuclease [Buchnera aphidicola (Periphyllus lyropictus)]USS94442.1 5'-3' exonuclease [Buchnera aphidicola (Periphyllus lyropictus)]